MEGSYYSIPIELMEILNRISDNVNDVKQRMARLEALDQTATIRDLWSELEKERSERVKLQIDLASVKTKLAPIVVGISMVGAVLIETFIKSLH